MYHDLTAVGYLGQDPEMRYTPSGTAVANFSLATNRKYKDSSGQTVEETCWFRVSAWGKLAENVNNYLHKGSQVLVTGTLRPDPATGGPKVFARNDGSAGASYEINASTIRFLDRAGQNTQQSQAAPQTVPVQQPVQQAQGPHYIPAQPAQPAQQVQYQNPQGPIEEIQV
jgi:single-strand DNA-binding protein